MAHTDSYQFLTSGIPHQLINHFHLIEYKDAIFHWYFLLLIFLQIIKGTEQPGQAT